MPVEGTKGQMLYKTIIQKHIHVIRPEMDYDTFSFRSSNFKVSNIARPSRQGLRWNKLINVVMKSRLDQPHSEVKLKLRLAEIFHMQTLLKHSVVDRISLRSVNYFKCNVGLSAFCPTFVSVHSQVHCLGLCLNQMCSSNLLKQS